MAIDKWRSYLQHGEFVIRTDQRSLIHLDDKRLTTPWQHKALMKLLGLQYKIVYKKVLTIGLRMLCLVTSMLTQKSCNLFHSAG